MNFPLYSDIILLHDLPEEGLYRSNSNSVSKFASFA